MELGFQLKDKILITSIDGEIDHHTSMEIRTKMDKYIEKNGIENVVFDFKNVRFMDSSGIGVVIGRYKNINELGGKVSVVNVSPQIKRIFEISGLFKIIPLYQNTDEAISNMEKGGEI